MNVASFEVVAGQKSKKNAELSLLRFRYLGFCQESRPRTSDTGATAV